MLPSERVRSFHHGLVRVNRDPLPVIEGLAKASVRRLGKGDAGFGQSGQHCLDAPLESWFLSCAELVVVNGSDEDLGLFVEPEHNDGGMSILHGGLTLYGRRVLRAKQGEGSPDVLLPCVLGHVYLGSLTGPTHQALRAPTPAWELLPLSPSLGTCGVTVMFRTALFPHNRGRMKDTTPGPKAVFEVLARVFQQVFGLWCVSAANQGRVCGEHGLPSRRGHGRQRR